MEYLKYAGVLLLFLAGAYVISRLMSRTSRNKGDRHGGGMEGASDGIECADD